MVGAVEVIDNLEHYILHGLYLRRTSMLGWMKFYELEDGAGDDEKYRIDDYQIYDITASSANITG